ncbi:Basic region leucine zipper [Musa troglodytarum]|uniref:Basic region leucine zipper n=2 Tax=Musa troglodytarum TaxID=320322 RepID=A0A9E7K865_9LILI|nr:Basic region leucine zipper [Musa troglodytarum]URE12533.1 Basic region leucine zipper [Musa troglodytarum]
MPMGSPKEKRTTGASSASTPAKAPPSTSSKAPREAAPPASALVPPEWSASFQAFYDRGAAAAAVMPQAFYSPSPVAAAQPVVWGAQQVMPPYVSPIAYASFYPQGGFYAQPPINAGVAFRTQETEGRPTEAKDNQPTSKRTSKILEGSPGKSGNDGKGASGAAENASQSDDSETEGSSDTLEDDDQPKEHSPNRKRSYGNTTEGEGSHSFDTAGNSGNAGRVRSAKKLPVSAPGRAALPGPPTNLNIGMDFWGASPAGSVPTKDEREVRRERRKQSNRESARRSRLRKQQECEELARRVTDLNNENSALRVELENLQKLCGELEAENKSITGELKQRYGPEFLSELSISIDASKLRSDVASS